MPDIDLERLLSEPIYTFDFRGMIGDIKDFLEFSESNIEWQYRRELHWIKRRAEDEDFPQGYEDHLIENADHRYKVTLPLQVRYSALIALTISVEWSIGFLVCRLNDSLPRTPKGANDTVHAFTELCKRTGLERQDLVRDYEALVQIRNCIAHAAGIEQRYRYREQLSSALDRLSGFSLGNWHYFGTHICIEKCALRPYIEKMGKFVVELYKALHEKGLLRDSA